MKAVGYLTPTPCLTIFYKARPYLVVANTYGLISKCANIAIRVSSHRRVITHISLIKVEVGINVEGVQKLQNH